MRVVLFARFPDNILRGSNNFSLGIFYRLNSKCTIIS